MKTTIKCFALLLTASFLYSCSPEEIAPVDTTNHFTTTQEPSPEKGAVKNEIKQLPAND